MYRSAWCEIDLAKFRRNLQCLCGKGPAKALLVVKANAYGHGLVRIGLEAVAAGIEMLGVATVGEAAALLDAGVTAPILIMCALDPTEIDFCVARGVHFIGWSKEHFGRAVKAAQTYGRKPNVHLEVDTGMSRSGVTTEELGVLVDSLSTSELRSIVGLMTHFHSADLVSTTSSEEQLADFHKSVKLLQDLRCGEILVHAANSPATIRIRDSHLGMVRLGIAAYGLPPSEYTKLPTGLEPVLRWRATVTNVKTIPAGMGVGYAWKYVAPSEQRVATLGIGYADGFRRAPHAVNTVLFRGVEAPVVGSVFMDQCLFVVPDSASCEAGEVVTLLGDDDGSNVLSAEKIAERWGTNNYDVVASIRDRVPRRYIGGIDVTSDDDAQWSTEW